VSLQPHDELVVGALGHSALLRDFLGQNAEALGGGMLTVPLERVAACEKISTVSQMYILSGCTSEVSQWHLNLFYVFSRAFG
jgi:hypothetical protein